MRIHHNRRDFLRLAAATAATVPACIQRALAIPAHSVTQSIRDIEHIVIFMQENRSFDHYFGTMRGVRGFGDRNAIPLSDGRSVWQQRSLKSGTEVLPFHFDTHSTRAQCVASLDHGWKTGHEAWNGGKYDNWIDAKTPLTMGYYKEQDIPFQFALANAFTICDAYFCSIMGPTDPNRICLWTGSINPPGNRAGALIDNDTSEKGIASWTTCPERLERAGISWRVCQQGIENDGKRPFEGNYGDNPLLYFTQYIHSAPDSTLRRNAMSVYSLADLASDVQKDRLPQVSWIVAPEGYSEHPAWPPAYGADYTSRVLEALTSNPEVWSKTALFINYDENDGFFDHVAPPTPPPSMARGKSTIDVSDEYYNDPHLGPVPYGLGARVPMIVVSPWTRGGWVCSQVFDHTSVLQFLEARFGSAMHEPNISAWRRTVSGDLTSAFDFTSPNASLPSLPDTSSFRKKTEEACRVLPDPAVPTTQSLPRQESGTRPSRPLPYRLHGNSRVNGDARRLWVDFFNAGTAGCVFHVYSPHNKLSPWVYTLGPTAELSDWWSLDPDDERTIVHEDRYAVIVIGPNGFRREMAGQAADVSTMGARLDSSKDAQSLSLALTNPTSGAVSFTVRDNAYGASMQRTVILPGSSNWITWPLAAHRWYDLTVTHDGNACYRRQFAGRVENGEPSIGDPAQCPKEFKT